MKAILIPLSLTMSFASAQTVTTITVFCQAYDGSAPISATTTGLTGNSCKSPTDQFINAQGSVSMSPAGVSVTSFSYSVTLSGQAAGFITGQSSVQVSSSVVFLIAGPSRPGFVSVLSSGTNQDEGDSSVSAGWTLEGIQLASENGVNHTFPISLQNLTFNGAGSGNAYDGNLIVDDAPSYFATASVTLAFYEADGVTPVSVTVQPAIPTLGFVPVSACRVVDTRNANGPFGGPPLAAGETRNYALPNGACGIPSTALAYSLNATVIPNGALSYLTIWPANAGQPNVSTLNSLDGRVKASAAIVPAATDGTGAINVYSTDPTNLVLDINGYYINGGLWFHPITPCRIWDTRQPGDGPLAASLVRSFPVAGVCGVPSADTAGIAGPAQAYSLNVTALPVTASLAYLTVFPGGASAPATSNLNAPTGTVTANAVIVPAGLGGAISVLASDNTNLLIDINGYFSAYDPNEASASFFPIAPTRVLDTRATSGIFNGTISVAIGGATSAIPADAQAFVLNATAVPTGSLEFLTLWPGAQSMPLVSTLNALDGWTTSNMAIVPGGGQGVVNAFASSSTDLIVDVFGYFR